MENRCCNFSLSNLHQTSLFVFLFVCLSVEIDGQTSVRFQKTYKVMIIWNKVFKNGPNKICRRQPYLKECGLPKAYHAPSNFYRQSSTNFTWSIVEYFDSYSSQLLFKFLYSSTKFSSLECFTCSSVFN